MHDTSLDRKSATVPSGIRCHRYDLAKFYRQLGLVCTKLSLDKGLCVDGFLPKCGCDAEGSMRATMTAVANHGVITLCQSIVIIVCYLRSSTFFPKLAAPINSIRMGSFKLRSAIASYWLLT